MKRAFIFSILGFAIALSLMPSSEASFISSSYSANSLEANEVEVEAEIPIAYIGNVYFTDLGAAIKYARESSEAETIYLIPSLGNSLDSDGSSSSWVKTQTSLSRKYAESVTSNGVTRYVHTLSSEDSLILPIDNSGTIDAWASSSTTFTDSTLALQKSNCVSELIIEEGVTLLIEGSLTVGAYTGYRSSGSLQGNVSGSYAQISLRKDAKIEIDSSNTSYIYGYIKEYDETAGEESEGVEVISGTLVSPLVLYDWTGGTWAYSIINDYFPISTFDMPNIQTLNKIDYGASFQLSAKVYVSGTYTTEAYFISTSSSSLFQLSSGSISLDYEPASTNLVEITTNGETRKIGLTTNDFSNSSTSNRNITNIDIAGNISVNNLSVEVSIYTMTTEDKQLPLSYKMNLSLEDGYTADIPSSVQMKFLPGSSFHIEEGATVNLEGSVVAYNNYNEAIRSPKYTTIYNVSNGGPGCSIINDGILNISGSYGGFLYTDNESGTAQTNFLNDDSYIASIKEAVSYAEGDIFLGYGTSYEVTYTTNQVYAIGNIYYTNAYQDSANFLGRGSQFPSTNTEEGLLGGYWHGEWDEESYVISVSFDTTTNDADKTASFSIVYSDETTSNVETEKTITGNADNGFTIKEGGYFRIKASSSSEIDSFYLDGVELSEGENVTPTEDMNLVVTVSASYYDITMNLDGASVTLKDVTDNKTFTSSTTSAIKKGNSFTVSVTYDHSDDRMCTITIENSSYQNTTVNTSTTYTATGNITIAASSSSGCLIPGTLINMADGSYKVVEDIEAGDYVVSFDHETGEMVSSKVLFNDVEEEKLTKVLYLDFSDIEVGVVYEHGYFDLDLNEYVYLNVNDYAQYIGDEFAYLDEQGQIKRVKLSSAEVKIETIKCYSPVTVKTLNYLTEGMLSMPGGIEGLFNYFEYDENTLAYDTDKKQEDIETYGLFTYEDFSSFGISEYIFNAFNGQYLKVAIGKGLLSMDRIAYLIERYRKYF